MTNPTMSAEVRARHARIVFGGMTDEQIIIVLTRTIRQAEQAAYERRDKDWEHWLAEIRVVSAEREFDIETAIMCGTKGEPTLHDAGQVGYAAALFVWEAAISERLKEIRALAQEPEKVG